MKQGITTLFLCALILSGCASGQMGNSWAVFTGAVVGGSIGSSVGGLIGESNHGGRGAYRGSAIGNIVGTIAGAAIGSAIADSQSDSSDQELYSPSVREVNKDEQATQVEVQAPVTPLKLRNIRFIDDNKNHEIDAGESSKIIFEIINNGDNTVYNVLPIVETTNQARYLEISSSVMIEQIYAGEGIRYTACVDADKRLRSGDVIFRVAVADENGVICDSREFTIPANRQQ